MNIFRPKIAPAEKCGNNYLLNNYFLIICKRIKINFPNNFQMATEKRIFKIILLDFFKFISASQPVFFC